MAAICIPCLVALMAVSALIDRAAAGPNGEAAIDPNQCAGEFSHCSDGSCTLGPCEEAYHDSAYIYADI